MSLFYPSNYGPYIDKPKNVKQKIFSKFFEFNETFQKKVNDGSSLLEIGAANGNYLEKMRGLGWQCLAVEPSKAACNTLKAKGFRVLNSTIEDLNLNEKFNVISLWMVVEHIYDLKLSIW
jgi:2-polyprenyl-3-methyl-5-hydroxy-6-metoxy-1,4-benzoquinol methylase